MAIKIISRGVDPKTKPLRGGCANCSTVVEALKADTQRYDFSDQRDQRSSISYDYVICPVCTCRIVMKPLSGGHQG